MRASRHPCRKALNVVGPPRRSPYLQRYRLVECSDCRARARPLETPHRHAFLERPTSATIRRKGRRWCVRLYVCSYMGTYCIGCMRSADVGRWNVVLRWLLLVGVLCRYTFCKSLATAHSHRHTTGVRAPLRGRGGRCSGDREGSLIQAFQALLQLPTHPRTLERGSIVLN